MKRYARLLPVILVVVFASAAVADTALGKAAKGDKPVIGKVGGVTGTVWWIQEGKNPEKDLQKVAVGKMLRQGDMLATDHDSSAKVDFTDGSVMKIGEMSRCVIRKKSTSAKKPTKLHLFQGKVRVKVKAAKVARGIFQVTTPTAVAGVRGTDFVVDCPIGQVTNVTVFTGVVAVSNVLGEVAGVVEVPAKHSTSVNTAQAPEAPAEVPAAELEQMEQSMTMDADADAGGGDEGAGAAEGEGEEEGEDEGEEEGEGDAAADGEGEGGEEGEGEEEAEADAGGGDAEGEGEAEADAGGEEGGEAEGGEAAADAEGAGDAEGGDAGAADADAGATDADAGAAGDVDGAGDAAAADAAATDGVTETGGAVTDVGTDAVEDVGTDVATDTVGDAVTGAMDDITADTTQEVLTEETQSVIKEDIQETSVQFLPGPPPMP